MRYTDEYLNHWGDEFTRRDLFARGIRFDTFLLDPRGIIAAVEAVPADQAPLLPRQAEVMHRQAQRDLEDSLVPATAGLRGEGYMETLRHHSWDVSQSNHLNRRATV